MTSLMDSAASTPTSADWDGLLERAIAGEGVRSVFQPIIDLQHCSVVGFEALSRFDLPGAPAVGPDRWLAEAERAGVSADLDARLLRSALAMRESLPRNCFLAVNADPLNLSSPQVRAVFAEQDTLAGLVIELTEHHAWNCDLLASALKDLRRSGATLAIDDAGVGHSGLHQILQLRPSIVKLDRSIIAGIDRDEAKVAMVEMLGVFASRVDAWILAEGVETTSEARCLHDLGVPLAQGYFFARPSDPWVGLSESVCRDVGALTRDLEPAPSLRRLIDHVEPVRNEEVPDHGSTVAPDVWKPVVNPDGRPVGVVNADMREGDEPFPTVIANIEADPRHVAYRVAAAALEPGAPIIVTDDFGKYRGIVSLRRLLRHLADESG